MKQKILLCTLIIFLRVLPLFSEEDSISIDIEFHNKKIFYLDKADEIKIKVSIINNSPQPYEFKLANDPIFNLDFDVWTEANIALDHAEDFTIRRGSFQYVFYREIELKPNEEYSFVVSLKDYIRLNRDGKLHVQAHFYPYLYDKQYADKKDSDVLELYINPAVLEPEELELVEEETGEILKREAIPPDDVIRFMLEARMRDEWAKFFLYFYIDSFIEADPEWSVRWQKSSEEERILMREEYKENFKNKMENYAIVTRPDEYTILKTVYEPDSGYVVVEERFIYPAGFTEVRYYTYYMKRFDVYWLLTSYNVETAGRE
jgi:hypothetical protein